ncbi:universal stress protein [Natronolimnobius sp. AArcel1]|uniref:universal stress protein n=1 Tax=Natronolimnobius sp. AArcel1 TaxID=1679093 RepID=UPI0013EAF213|nr:universal stress protein [Natronolimnobius sp. AArcel1]NGM68400.1 universal stress protein [Natronolimnobius sp. AArcel1]
MSNSVLVPVDGSPAAEHALEYAREQFPDVTLTLLYVMNPMVDYSRRQSYPGYTGDDEFSNERDRGEAILEATAESIPDGVTVETALEAGDPARTIVSYADDHDCSQIVIGSHGRDGLARFLLGSVAETVVRRSAVPVTVVRPEA